MGNQFYYLFNVYSPDDFVISDNLKQVLGYSPGSFGLNDLYAIIHPRDRYQVSELSRKMIEIGYRERYREPLRDVFYIDYRVRHKEGHYLKVNRSTAVYEDRRESGLLLILGLIRDIDYLCSGDSVHYHYVGKQEKIIREMLDSAFRMEFTRRELEVLRLIARGFSSREIALRLNISFFTVNTHRRNMLSKISGRNATDLINYAKENGIL